MPAPLTPEQLESIAVCMADFEKAVALVQPSLQREGFTTTPDVTWADVGSLSDVQEKLSMAITQPIADPARFAKMGLRAAQGMLLYGPPGCGKTLVAKAVANESGANFISIKGPELLNKYVGESERAVRTLFRRARSAAPCVLFFDELDALAPRRSAGSENQSSERVVTALLAEMDGVEGRGGVFVVAATNRPDVIDSALLRPGRLDKSVYVTLPGPGDRASILRAITRSGKPPLAPDVDLEAIALDPQANNYSGADLQALVREAAVFALKEMSQDATLEHVHARHFRRALASVQPSVSERDRRRYENLRKRLASSRGHLDANPEEGLPVGPGATAEDVAPVPA